MHLRKPLRNSLENSLKLALRVFDGDRWAQSPDCAKTEIAEMHVGRDVDGQPNANVGSGEGERRRQHANDLAVHAVDSNPAAKNVACGSHSCPPITLADYRYGCRAGLL